MFLSLFNKNKGLGNVFIPDFPIFDANTWGYIKLQPLQVGDDFYECFLCYFFFFFFKNNKKE